MRWSELVKKVAVVGSRDWPDPMAVVDYIASLPKGTVVISGGAEGVDSWAAKAARRRSLEVVEFLPDWKQFGRQAGLVRNTKIVEAADEVVAFHFDSSPGTADTIRKAEAAGKKVLVFRACKLCRRALPDHGSPCTEQRRLFP